LHDADNIPVDFQHEGCESHVLHPDLVPWQRKDGPDEGTAIYVIDGNDVKNGLPSEDVYSSKEILLDPSVLNDPTVKAVRMHFPGATIVGVNDATS
jgi:hypothetical protein